MATIVGYNSNSSQGYVIHTDGPITSDEAYRLFVLTALKSEDELPQDADLLTEKLESMLGDELCDFTVVALFNENVNDILG